MSDPETFNSFICACNERMFQRAENILQTMLTCNSHTISCMAETMLSSNPGYNNTKGIIRNLADDKNAIALHCLGLCFENGTGVEKDYIEARRLYLISEQGGYGKASNGLSRCAESTNTNTSNGNDRNTNV